MFSQVYLSGVAFLRDAVMLPGVKFASSAHSSEVTSSYGVVTVGQVDPSSIPKKLVKIVQADVDFVSRFAYELSKHRCYEREMDGLTAKVAF